MGGQPSLPIWDRQYPAGWDEWGYVPPGAVKPSQHVWSEWYQDKRPPSNKPTLLYNYGNPDDVLQNFGAFSFADKITVAGPENPPQYAHHQMSDVHYVQPSYSPQGDTTRCTPLNFPNCSFATARNKNAASVTPYVNDVIATYQPNGTWKPGKIAPSVDIFDRWQTAANDMYQKYEGHGFDYVYNINSNDTSNYDPCTGPTLFEVLVPLALAGGATFLVARFGEPVFEVLPSTCRPVIMLSTFMFMWEYGRGSVNFFINPELHDSSMQRAATALASGLTYTLGAYAGDYYSNNISFNDNPYFEPLGGVTSIYLLMPQLQPKLALAIKVSTFGGLGLGLISAVFHYVSYFFCGVASWGKDACADNDTFPDARRWDVASLCARLTDYACDSEGWSRSDPRAEFVFRSLMTQFDWQFAAQPDTTTKETMYDRMKGVNPIGSIVQVETTVERPTINPFSLSYREMIYGLDANAAGESWNGISGTNSYFACQNFNTMFCDSEKSGTCNAGGDTEGTRTFSANMHAWLDAAINNAYDPNNLDKMTHIPGWSNKKTRFDYDLATYLATCHKDFDEEAGTGFNDMRSRGEWAQDFDVTKLDDSVQKTTLLANSFFASASLTDAMTTLLAAKWNDQNMIAWAHYIYYRKGLYQTDDFDRWCGNGDPRVDTLWKQPNHGFSAHPHDLGGGDLRKLPKILGELPLPLLPPTLSVLPEPLTFKQPFKSLHDLDSTTPVSGGDWQEWHTYVQQLQDALAKGGMAAAIAQYNGTVHSIGQYKWCEISADDAGVLMVVVANATIPIVSQAYYEWFTCMQTGNEPLPPPWWQCNGGNVSPELKNAYIHFSAATWIADPKIFEQLLPEQQAQVEQWLSENVTAPKALQWKPIDLDTQSKSLQWKPDDLQFKPQNLQWKPDKLTPAITGLQWQPDQLAPPLAGLQWQPDELSFQAPLKQTTPLPHLTPTQPTQSGDWAKWHNWVAQLFSAYQSGGVSAADEFISSTSTQWHLWNICEMSVADSGMQTAIIAIINYAAPNDAFNGWYEDFLSGAGTYAPVWNVCGQPTPSTEYVNAFTYSAAQVFIAQQSFYTQLSAQNQAITTKFFEQGNN